MGDRARERQLLYLGLMSGTSADGVDAALVRITGCGTRTRLDPLGFEFLAYPDDLRAEVRIAAVYFKTWAYHSQYMASFDQRLQPAPMFMGIEPEVLRRQQAANPYVGYAAGVIFVAALVGVWYGMWRWNRADRRFHRALAKRQVDIRLGQARPDAHRNDADLD